MRFPFAGPGTDVPWWSRLFGVSSTSGYVYIDDDRMEARFGPWSVSTPIENITGARITGPYSWWKVVGPARYSLADRSLTFATRTDRGVEISFATPVRGLDPWGGARHPSLTVTVADPESLVEFLRR
jgi:hypothetical protein